MSKCEEHCLKYDLSMGKSEENRRILQTVVPYVTTSRNNDPMDTGFEKSFFFGHFTTYKCFLALKTKEKVL